MFQRAVFFLHVTEGRTSEGFQGDSVAGCDAQNSASRSITQANAERAPQADTRQASLLPTRRVFL